MATARWFLACVLLLLVAPKAQLAQAPAPLDARAVKEDVDALWRYVAENYAYFDQKSVNWQSIPQLYADDLKGVSTRQEFVGVLERIVEELYDHHAHLNTDTAASPRLVPSGADIWAAWQNGQARVLEVRSSSDAERAGITAGSVIVSINGMPIDKAIDARVPRSLSRPDDAARSWALRMLLAGRRGLPRVIGFTKNALSMTVELPAREQQYMRDGRLTSRTLEGNRGYIRIHDSLGDFDLIADFDKALAALQHTSALILDLRDTPGGGNSTVARGILGRFVDRELPYQKHVLPSEARDTGVARSWLELVRPRRPFRYVRPVAVLVNRWTGSMGEGIAIGFDATRAGIIVGTPMAGLLGATYQVALPHSRIGVNVPAEQLFVNGTPREKFIPKIAVDLSAAETDDAWIAKAFGVFR